MDRYYISRWIGRLRERLRGKGEEEGEIIQIWNMNSKKLPTVFCLRGLQELLWFEWKTHTILHIPKNIYNHTFRGNLTINYNEKWIYNKNLSRNEASRKPILLGKFLKILYTVNIVPINVICIVECKQYCIYNTNVFVFSGYIFLMCSKERYVLWLLPLISNGRTNALTTFSM